VGRDGKSKDEKPAMNEHEKSDHPIVPAKPPNKGTGEAPRPAEAVEGRGWAKGNPSQGDTSRTQSRVKGVPSALERIGADRTGAREGEPSSPLTLTSAADRSLDPRQEPSAGMPHAGICVGGTG